MEKLSIKTIHATREQFKEHAKVYLMLVRMGYKVTVVEGEKSLWTIATADMGLED